MKCFYCSNVSEVELKGFCISCGKKLDKICHSCEISYEENANFCMSCGGKLEELPEKADSEEILIDEHIEVKVKDDDDEVFVLEEVVPDSDVVVEKEEPESFEPKESDDIEIEVNGSVSEVLVEDVSAIEEKNKEKSESKSKQLKKIKSKKEQKPAKEHEEADIIVKVEGKTGSESEENVDFDALFDELSSLDVFSQESAEEEGKRVDLEEVKEDGDEENGKEGGDFSLNSEKILVKEPDQYLLNPAKVDEEYNVSFDLLIDKTVTPECEKSCIPMLRKIEERLRICKGGAFYFKGSSGSGKNHFVNRLKGFAEKNVGEDGYNIVVSDANIFDFDFMIFINVIKALMKITSTDPGVVKKKFDKLFGEALPDNKKECLSALICLNFSPVKTKLPKHDIEYLLSYVLYGLSRNKPVLWVINNANALNVRTIKFFAKLNRVFESTPMSVIFVVDPDAAVLANSSKENVYLFEGFPEDRLVEEVGAVLNTKKIPAELEKLLKEKAKGNILFTIQLTEYLKDKGYIFEMKGTWRFSKLPDDFVAPETLDELISLRIDLLSEDVARTLMEFALLNLYEVPKSLFTLVATAGEPCIKELVRKGYLIETPDFLRFTSRSMLTALKKKIKIGKKEKVFYKELVSKLASTPAEIYHLNKHWLLLSYISLGGIVDRRMNPFLFSSAVYMEKLGFFEISQRSYQTIVSSFEPDDANDDFKILPEIKNARLWRIIEPQWAKIFWDKLAKYAKTRFNYHLELVARGELLLLEEDVDMGAIADVIKKLHTAGCYEEEIGLIDRATDIFINSGSYHDANTLATRGYKILRDVIVKYDGKGVSPAEFIYSLYIRCACKLAEVCIILNDNDKANAILEEALEYAEKYSVSYFKSKILLLLGKIRYARKSEWEGLMKDGFYNAIIGMDFSIIKAFLHFFEDNNFEDKEWVTPFIEYKNWINF